MALVVKRTAAAGGADATQTSALGVWGIIDALLIAAGWTMHFNYLAAPGGWAPSTILPPFSSSYSQGQIISHNGNIYQCTQGGIASTNPTGPSGEALAIADGTVVWRFITSAAGAAKVYFSNGESGTESLYVRVDANTNALSVPAVNIHAFQYFDVATAFGYNRLHPAVSVHQYQYTPGAVVNYVMVANKDAFQVFTNDAANLRRLYGTGRLKRIPFVNANNFVSNGTVTAGTNKTFTFASGDPVAAGYKVKDRVFVVSQQTNPAAPYNQQIPIFAANIVGVTTNSITVDVAHETTSAGAIVGGDPMCLFTWGTSITQDPSTSSGLAISNIWNKDVANIWAVQGEFGYASGAGGNGGIIDTGGVALDPNARTSRVGLGEVFLFQTNGATEISGILPLIYSNPRTTDALWAIGRTVKETPNYDYVTFPSHTPTPTGWRRYALGPIATSGASTYLADLFTFDNLNTWIEAEVPETIWPQADKAGPSSNIYTDVQYRTYVGDIEVNDDSMCLPIVAVERNNNQGTDKVGAVSEIQPTGELTPFDSSGGSGAGTGSSGFNGGFN